MDRQLYLHRFPTLMFGLAIIFASISYSNVWTGTARDIINNNQGVEKLLQLMRDILNDREESSEMLRKVACGFFFNLNHEHGILFILFH